MLKTTIKFNHLAKIIFAFLLLISIVNCESNNDFIKDSHRVPTTDFTEADLFKMHNGTEKSWRLTKVIIPDEYKDYPSVLNSACVADDIYTFSALTATESIKNIQIDLGDTRCFESISDSENFEAKLLFVPYKFNNVDVVETTLILEYSQIEHIENNGTSTVTNIDAFRLVELTEDKMVFSNATYIGEYTFGFVFESIIE